MERKRLVGGTDLSINIPTIKRVKTRQQGGKPIESFDKFHHNKKKCIFNYG